MNTAAIHGRNAVEEALQSPGRVNRILVAKESRAQWLSDIIDTARADKVRVDTVPQAKLNRIAGTREHQGVVAVVSPLDYTPLADCLANCPRQATLLVVDQIQNPKNLGMLIRTAVGAGAAGVLLAGRGGALLDEDVVRASAGTVFHIPIVKCRNICQALRDLKKEDFWIYGLDAHGEQDLFQISWPDRVALVLGNETAGLRPNVTKLCDTMVRIPLAGGIDSLNIVVAGSVAMFQALSRRAKE